MPLGEHVTETGRIIAHNHRYALRRDDGGVWELDFCPEIKRFEGQRVSLEGRRIGFNLLACERVWPIGAERPTKPIRSSEWLITSALVAVALLASAASFLQ